MSTERGVFNHAEREDNFERNASVPEQDGIVSVSSVLSFYDKEEIYPDCTVQVLTNTKTGEVSVGWWRNSTGDEDDD